MSEKQKPFVDTGLEERFLRAIIAKGTEGCKNLLYITENKCTDGILTTMFRKWFFIIITNYYTKYGNVPSDTILKRYFVKKFKKKAEIESNWALYLKIKQLRYKKKDFQPIYDELRNLQGYRFLIEQGRDLGSVLEDAVETKQLVSSKVILENLKLQLSGADFFDDDFSTTTSELFDDISGDINLLREKSKQKGISGISTGIPPLDEMTDGWQSGDFIIVIGRPGFGKSIMLEHFTICAARDNNLAVYFAIEMPLAQIKRRAFSNLTGVEYVYFKRPQLLDDDKLNFIEEQLSDVRTKFSGKLIVVDTPENVSTDFIRAKIKDIENLYGRKVTLVVVDPIYSMTTDKKWTSDAQRLAYISWDLKKTARAVKCSIIGANQINREGRKRHLKGAQMDTMDAAFSDRFSNDCDIMLGINYDGADLVQLNMIKARDSEKRSIYLRAEFGTMRVIYDEAFNQEMDED